MLYTGTYQYTDENFNSRTKASSFLRVEVLFGKPICIADMDPSFVPRFTTADNSYYADRGCFLDQSDQSDKQREYFEGYVKQSLYPYLKTVTSDKFEFFFGGDVVTDVEILSHLEHDAKMAIITAASMLVLMWWHLGSFPLAFLGLLQVSLPLPTALRLVSNRVLLLSRCHRHQISWSSELDCTVLGYGYRCR